MGSGAIKSVQGIKALKGRPYVKRLCNIRLYIRCGAASTYTSDAISIRLKRIPLVILNARFIQKPLVFVSPVCAVVV